MNLRTLTLSTLAALSLVSCGKDDDNSGEAAKLAAQVAKANGAKVIITGITKDKPRLELAKEIGIDIAVDSLVEDLSP